MKSNEEAIQELKEERAEVIMRATNLDRFMEKHGSEVAKNQRHAMRDQQSAMWSYAHALGERIEDLRGSVGSD